jgi:hypothetical protein
MPSQPEPPPAEIFRVGENTWRHGLPAIPRIAAAEGGNDITRFGVFPCIKVVFRI